MTTRRSSGPTRTPRTKRTARIEPTPGEPTPAEPTPAEPTPAEPTPAERPNRGEAETRRGRTRPTEPPAEAEPITAAGPTAAEPTAGEPITAAEPTAEKNSSSNAERGPSPRSSRATERPRVTAPPPAALTELRIRDLGVIRDAVLHLGPGLTVLSGETGAGKTMLVTAVLLLFGGRADAQRVRPGAEQAVVDGRLSLPADHPALVRVRDAGGELDDDGSVLLRRMVSANGRSRAFAGGAPVPVGVLADIAATVLAVHGQSDQLRLARPAEQRAALDRYAVARDPAATSVFEAWRDAYRAWQAADAALRDRQARAGEMRREAEMLRHGLAAIAKAAPVVGEDVELAARETRLAHLDGLREAARTAHDLLLGDPDDPVERGADVVTLLGQARWALEHAGDTDDPRLAEITRRVVDLAGLIADLGADLSSYLADLDADGADPLALARLQERRHELTSLVRTYGDADGGVDAVIAWASAAQARLSGLDTSDEALAELTGARDAARDRAGRTGDVLSKVRCAAAAELGTAVTAELAGLAMGSARIDVLVTTPQKSLDLESRLAQSSADGLDDVAIVLTARPDAPPLPVHRGASGGELSRVMLALEAVLAGTDPVPLLVFDEVDAGVGGRAAVEVGARLARLGRHHQVLVVTHLAQVAAAGDAQIVVSRTSDSAVSGADLLNLAGNPRIAELARMLSGQDTPTARRHARELLAGASAGDTS